MKAMPMTELTISILGPFQVIRNGEAVSRFGSDTARALLVYLVMNPGVAHRRDALAGLLWPEQPNADALRNLRVVLSRLRDAIGDREVATPYLEVTRQTIQFNADERTVLDALAIQEAVTAVKKCDFGQDEVCEKCVGEMQKVADLYRGEFLNGFSVDSAPFEEWVVVTRENMHWQVLEVLGTLTDCYLKKGEYEEAINYARRQVELESWRESAHRQWMRALALSGQRGAAMAQFETCRQVMVAELGVEPEGETVELYERIRNGELAPHSEIITSPVTIPNLREVLQEQTVPKITGVEPASVIQPIIPEIPAGERRTVTVVQMEILGLDVLNNKNEAENWALLVSQLLNVARTEIHRYEGEVNRYDARGLLALFGVRRVHEDDPERGVLAALAMQEAVQAQLEQFTEEQRGAEDVELQIGVHTGQVIITAGGSDGRTYQTVIGDAIQVANQMMGAIPAGEVVVSEATHHLTAALFEWEPLEGNSRYVAFTHLISAERTCSLFGMQSELVGRGREIHTLHKAVEELQSGIGSIVTLTGEAGIGKSRLVAEIHKSSNLQWIEGRCVSYSGTVAYSLWRGILYSLLGISSDTPPAVSRHVLRKRLGFLGGESLALNYTCLARLLSIPMDDASEELIRKLDTENLKNVTFNAIEVLLEKTALQQELILVCEDLHWADPTSLALLEGLLGLTDRVPILFICIFRPEREHGSWQIRETALRVYPHRHVDIQLTALSVVDGEKLLENLLLSLPIKGNRKPVEDLPDVLKMKILNWSDGNPFYTEEILRELVRNNTIVCDEVSCVWQTQVDVQDISIPDTLYGVLQSRIDRLPVGAQHILHIASVIGRIFSYTLLAEIADRRNLDEYLVILLREQLIRERTRLPEMTYIFNHQLTLEAAYDSLLNRVSRELHRRIAQAMETAYAGRIEDYHGRLGHHWEKAGDIQKAVYYLHLAGMRAEEQYANEEAVGYLNQALDLIPDNHLLIRYDLLSLRVKVYDRLGSRQKQQADLVHLQNIADALNNGNNESIRRLAEVALQWAVFYNHTSNHTSLAEVAQKAVRMAQLVGDKGLEAEGYLQWGGLLEKALDLAKKSGHTNLEAQILRQMGLMGSEDPSQFDKATSYLEQNLQIHRKAGNLLEEGKALNALGVMAIRVYDLFKAKTYVEEGLRICRMTGNRREEAYALSSLSFIMFALGQYAESEKYLLDALHIFNQVGDTFGVSLDTIMKSLLALIQDDVEASLELSQKGVKVAQAIESVDLQAMGLIVYGDALARKMQWLEASQAYQDVLQLREDEKWTSWEVNARAGLARVAHQKGELNRANRYVHQILRYLDSYPELPATDNPMRVYLTCYRVLSESDLTRADILLDSAFHILQVWAERIENPDLRRSFLENVPENRELVMAYQQKQQTK